MSRLRAFFLEAIRGDHQSRAVVGTSSSQACLLARRLGKLEFRSRIIAPENRIAVLPREGIQVFRLLDDPR